MIERDNRLRRKRRPIVLMVLGIAILQSTISLLHSTIASMGNNSDHELPLRSTVPIPTTTTSRPSDNPNDFYSSLSYRQSLGFFNDIPDDSWKLMQQRARTFIQYSNPTQPAAGHENPIMRYLNNLQPDFTCPHVRRVGGHGNGPKWTCDPHRLAKTSSAAAAAGSGSDCLVYSVGSEGKYDFEDSLIREIGGTHCEIHVFDPGNYRRVGDASLRNIHYHSCGFKSSYDHEYDAAMITLEAPLQGQKPKLLSFQETLQELGHQDRRIDILKIGCEKCEWASYNDWISADIRQVLIETHGVPSPDKGNSCYQSSMTDFFDAFHDNNYAMFSKEVNVRGGGDCIEFSYIKLHSDFWNQDDDGGNNTADAEMPPETGQVAIRGIVVPEAPPAAYKIPHRLIYVTDPDLFQTEEPVETFFNVKHTAEKYRKAWGEDEVKMWLLSEEMCIATIYQAKAQLAYVYYRIETNEKRRHDMCRFAALYLSGGYYFDVEVEASTPYKPADHVSLVVAREGDDLSDSFLACEPKSNVIKMVLDNMLHFYKLNQNRPGYDLGKALLAEAYETLRLDTQADIVRLSNVTIEFPVPWIVYETPVESFDNPVPTNMRGDPSAESKIPRRLIFTFKDSLLETKEPLLLYDNVRNTIDTYREAWGVPDAPVWFLNDTDCRAAIYKAKPRLLTYFDREPHGSWKADMCRVAALFLTGGYYFDVDMEVVNPWIHDRNVAFATALSEHRDRFFQSFIASEKKGRVMEEALDEMLLFYEAQKSRTKMLLGCDTLKTAFESVAPSECGKAVFLEEVRFSLPDATSPVRRNGVGCCCDLSVQDQETHEVLFYSRVVGVGHLCFNGNSTEGQAWLDEEFATSQAQV